MAALTVCTTAAGAQNLQNWLTNQASQIRQDMSSGVINANQATGLAAREAQIQAQEQQFMSQNGGTLTPGESHLISRELRGVGHSLQRTVQGNNPPLMTGYPNGAVGYPNGYGLPQFIPNPSGAGYIPNPAFMQNGNFVYPVNMTGNGVYPNGTFPNNGTNGYPFGYRHHHHQWNQTGY